ncbi:MAG: hypothetical protein IPM33_05825 [Phycisphaerales bacterium]|nr:hypothetical protein [Phycisphaerales bacterium]
MTRMWTLLVPLWLLGGCAGGGGSPRVEIPAGMYAQAFDAARETLREHRFTIERVDAEAGVVTTRAKTTAGLGTPWDSEQSSLEQEFEDLVNDQRRRVRVTFKPPADAPATDTPWQDGPVVAEVDVSVYRAHNPGLRLPPRAMSQGSVTEDPALKQRWVTYGMETPVARDSRLAARLAEQIRRRLSQAAR